MMKRERESEREGRREIESEEKVSRVSTLNSRRCRKRKRRYP